jgi:hypothetical protein
MSFIINNTFGSLSSASDGSIVGHIFSYVLTILHDFKMTKDENENGITNRLCKMLEFKKPPEYPFFFHHQNIESAKQNTSTDFAVFGTYSYVRQLNFADNGEAPALIKFEAKRLINNLPKRREREYVIGDYKQGKQIRNSGGIERFKNGRHGIDIIHACIIGYIQSDSFVFWKGKIDRFVQDEINNPHDQSLSWDNDDFLKFIKSDNNIYECVSKPKRKSGCSIDLRHIWIELN